MLNSHSGHTAADDLPGGSRTLGALTTSEIAGVEEGKSSIAPWGSLSYSPATSKQRRPAGSRFRPWMKVVAAALETSHR